MNRVGCTFNIGYEMPDAGWKKLAAVYERLPEFIGYDESGCPSWYGRAGDGRKHLHASVEPSGLLVEGVLEDEEWKSWSSAFQSQASAALGFYVRDAEE